MSVEKLRSIIKEIKAKIKIQLTNGRTCLMIVTGRDRSDSFEWLDKKRSWTWSMNNVWRCSLVWTRWPKNLSKEQLRKSVEAIYLVVSFSSRLSSLGMTNSMGIQWSNWAKS